MIDITHLYEGATFAYRYREFPTEARMIVEVASIPAPGATTVDVRKIVGETEVFEVQIEALDYLTDEELKRLP